MSENKLRDDLRMHWRALRLSSKIVGKRHVLHEVLSDLMPQIATYISAYYSGKVITALTQNAPFAEPFRYAAIAVMAVFLLWLVRRLSTRKLMTLRNASYWRGIEMMTRKALSLDFGQVETPAFADLFGRVENNNSIAMGIAGQSRRVSVALSNLFSVLIAVSMASGMVVTRSGGPQTGILRLANSPLFGMLFALFVFALIGLSIFSNDAVAKRRFKEFEKIGKIRAVGQYYYDRVLNESGSSEDIRIYREKPLILEEMRDWVFDQRIQIEKMFLRLDCTFGLVSSAVAAVLGGAVYLFVGLKALSGAFGAGKVVEYYGILTQMIAAFSTMAQTLGTIHSNRFHIREDLEFYDLQPVMQLGTRTIKDVDPQTVEIGFCDVSFRYPGSETYALQHLNMTIRRGEKLAVVGRNGSGKTTMIKLLCRLYDPTEGVITLNGVDIREFDTADYLRLFGVVFQDFQLLSFSVAENVAGSSDYDEAKVWECLDMAGLRTRVEEMPNGLAQCVTKLYDKDGVDLSGGESQKLAIARALYKDAPFVILDEPTAALDPKSESEVYSKFDAISGGRTAVYISHRMSSCRFCERIVVFADGKAVEQGTHDELLRQNGEYAALWYAQAQHYSD